MTEGPSNAQLLDRFYTALSLRDHRTMGACYLPDARFSDPVFGELHGDEVRRCGGCSASAGQTSS